MLKVVEREVHKMKLKDLLLIVNDYQLVSVWVESREFEYIHDLHAGSIKSDIAITLTSYGDSVVTDMYVTESGVLLIKI